MISSQRLLRARIVLPQAGPPIEDGAVIIKEGEIIAVGDYRDLASASVGERIDLGEQILLPGLINAHCHLDYTGMRNKIPPEKFFSQWLQRIIALKGTQTHQDYLTAIGEGFKELRHWGTTSVFNIGSIPEIMGSLPTPSLRTWWFHELMDIRSPVDMEKLVGSVLAFSKKQPSWLGGFGLSPHAPYTASRDLYQTAKFYAEQHALPVATHLAETSEELEMFRTGCGPLFDFLKGVGRSMRDYKTKSPVAFLLEENLLPYGSILIHMNALDESDWEIVRRHASDFTVVHCPKTHAYFGREKFHFAQLRQSGVTICLGTDSLASNDSLNLFEEMRLFLRLHGVTEQEVLDRVTLHPAKAIGLADRLGIITAGACADLIAIPYSGRLRDTVAAVVNHSQPIDWAMIGGIQC
jgi:cytosine/adenosine deaminase-related metal-dependent hydrolase